eukprot:SAG31_NODE_657_length_13108_cov_3.079330_2_plen_191_part_00
MGGIRDACVALLVRAVGSSRNEKSGVKQFALRLWASGHTSEQIRDDGKSDNIATRGVDVDPQRKGKGSKAFIPTGGPVAVLEAVASAILEKARSICGDNGTESKPGTNQPGGGLDELWYELQTQVDAMHAEEELRRTAEVGYRGDAPWEQSEFRRYNFRLDANGNAANHAAHLGSSGLRARDLLEAARNE